ncbi:MAG: uracil-DNA glycosylase family protein [Verrucomicrobiales bacterium]|jgi:uracil-DNA glycosylase|nr:uracil-DNA glycosylase family protein [Verrucomicrobiales bacterium]
MKITELYQRLLACDLCPLMAKPVVSGRPVMSKVMLIGQAPGIKEPLLMRPFAWTAGKTMFKWFREAWGVEEETFRARAYMAAVCRCYPGKNPKGGDRVPADDEIDKCSHWLKAEFAILRPALILAVGKLAIRQFVEFEKLNEVVGRIVSVEKFSRRVDVVPLPHPSGASTWHRMEPGKTLLRQALTLTARHPAFQETFDHKNFYKESVELMAVGC